MVFRTETQMVKQKEIPMAFRTASQKAPETGCQRAILRAMQTVPPKEIPLAFLRTNIRGPSK
jgi:hypothetical protein